jgi:flagellar assembly protein FliH
MPPDGHGALGPLNLLDLDSSPDGERDGFTPIAYRDMRGHALAAKPRRVAGFEFDQAPAPPAAPPPPPPPVEDRTPQLIAAARAEGYAAGLAAGRAERAEAAEEAARLREEAALAALRMAAGALEDGGAGARAVAQDSAEALGRLATALLRATLPAIAARFAEAEVAAFAQALLPALQEEPSAELRVAPELAPLLQGRFAHHRRVVVEEDAALQPGDAVLRWRQGEAVRRQDALQAAIDSALAGCGLAHQQDLPGKTPGKE